MRLDALIAESPLLEVLHLGELWFCGTAATMMKSLSNG